MLTLTISFGFVVLFTALLITVGVGVILALLAATVGAVFVAPFVIDVLMFVGLCKLLFGRKKHKKAKAIEAA